MINVLQEQLVAIVGTALTMVAGYAVKQLKEYLDKKGVTEKLKVYESSAKIAVSAVEQIYYNEDGPKKFEKAKQHMSESLQAQGLPVTDKDLQYWIESAVYGMKTGWVDTIAEIELPEPTITVEAPKEGAE